MRLAPSSAAGWSRIRSAVDADGALDACSKALLLACAAAGRGLRPLLERELERLRELGGADLVAPAAGVLLLARGPEAAGLLGVPLEPAAGEPPGDVDEAVRYFAGAADPPPPFVGLLATEAPEALLGYRMLRAGIYDETSLPARLVELVLFAVSAAGYQGAHAAVHAAKALEQGASVAQLVEAGLCAVPAGGMPAWLAAAGAIDALDGG